MVARSTDGAKPDKEAGQSMSALPVTSDVNLFCNREGVVELDAEISDGAFDLGVS